MPFQRSFLNKIYKKKDGEALQMRLAMAVSPLTIRVATTEAAILVAAAIEERVPMWSGAMDSILV